MAQLSERDKKALARLGDIMIPGDGDFPSFSESGCVDNINTIAAEADPDDIQMLSMFLKIVSIKPKFALRIFCFILMKADSFPEFLAVPLRQLNIALRGMIISPYFSNLCSDAFTGRDPHAVMGYELTRIED